MTKTEQIHIREKVLFDLIDKWKSKDFMLSNESILEELPDHYSSTRTIQRDITTLKDKFLIHAEQRFINKARSIRKCKVVNRNKDIRRQSDANYLEEMVLANPDSFKIKWRIGYDHNEGGVQKYVDTLEDNRGTTCLGVFLLNNPNKMLSKKPVRYKPFYIKDIESMGIEIDQPIPF